MKNYRQFTIRMDPDLLDQVKGRAEANHRSVNAEIVTLIEDSIDRRVSEDQSLLSKTESDQVSD
jgi:hypothetical protein